MSADVDVVIVGAGAAGLAAAKAAQGRGLTFHLIEAAHRIGGRAYTEEMAPGMPMDLGCHWMHSASLNPFPAIADRLGFHYRRDGAWRMNGFMGARRLTEAEHAEVHRGMAGNYAAIAKAAARGEDVAVSEVMDLDHPWVALHAYWFSLGTSHDPDEISTIDVDAYNDTDENWPVREGYGALVAGWGADVPVTLNAAATRIRWGSGGVVVETVKGNIAGRRLLLTVSTNLLASGRIAFDPPLPDWKLAAAGALPLGVHNRIGILLKRNPFGPEAPTSATLMLDGEMPIATQLRPFGYDYVVGVTGGRHGAWLERAGAAASVDYLTERLVGAFGSDIRAALSTRSIVTAWAGDPWTLGSYSSASPGASDQRAVLARPIDDILFFAGEACSVEFAGTAHGAYLTAVAAVEGMAGL
ncbi:flavin monoamine oxidase family protein [Dongia sp.]|uniref:flavin monoamine oxidase family protein n=1 Tax=Dongia sp. TaxID=1977262 RepID=UPI003752CC58